MWRRSSRILLRTFHRLAQLIYADVQSAGESCFKLLSLVLPLRLTLEGMSRWQTGGGNNTRRGYAEHQDRCAYDETCFRKSVVVTLLPGAVRAAQLAFLYSVSAQAIKTQLK
jgi:hypothetical protein